MQTATVQDHITRRRELTLAVKEMMIRQVNLPLVADEIDDDAPLFGHGLGLDSIDALELIVGLEQEFNVVVAEHQKGVFRSVNSIVDYLVAN